MKCNANNCNTTAQKGGDFVPRLAMINDIAGFGRCSTTVSLPVISIMKVQVCPVPTSVLSNHLGFPLCHFDDYTSHMRDYIKVWSELGLTFDGLYCGFLGNEEQIDIVREFVEMFRPPLFLLDPVMGDHGRSYSSITKTHVQKMKELLPLADIITPNITEACLLTDTPWKDGEWTMPELSDLCLKLATLCQTDSTYPYPSIPMIHPIVLSILLVLFPVALPSSSPASARGILWSISCGTTASIPL